MASKSKSRRRQQAPQQRQQHTANRAAGAPVRTGAKSYTVDALVNQLARIGTPDTLLAENAYQATRLTQQYQLMDSLFRGDWIANRIITTIPEDMTKNWFSLTCSATPEQKDVLETIYRKTHIRERLAEGLRWGRLYGGAAAVMMIKGQEEMLDQPLNMELLMPGDFKGLIVCDRWNGVHPSLELVDDLDDPDFGMPEYYTFTLSQNDAANSVEVHHSRVLRFTGRELPYIERVMEEYWGMSELEHVFEELNKRNSASANIAQLIFIAHLRVLKMEDLGQNLALMDGHSQEELYNTLAAQNRLMNNMSLQVMSKDDDFQTFEYSFSGLSDVYEEFMMDVAGAAEIPATKLFGRAPQGMNATGEGDLRNYYDTVKQNQEAHLRPVLEKLLPVICMSAWGMVPDDLDFEFNPIRDPSDEERASLIQQQASAINSVFQSGIISQKIALQELRTSGAEHGMWDSITDEFIASADDSANPEGEMGGGGMEDMLGDMMGGGGPDGAPPQKAPPMQPGQGPQPQPGMPGMKKPAMPQRPQAQPQPQARPAPNPAQRIPQAPQPQAAQVNQTAKKPSILSRLFGRG